MTELKMSKPKIQCFEAERLICRKEAARLLGTSVATVRRLERDGLLKPIRLRRNGNVFFRLSDIYALIEKLSSDEPQLLSAEGGRP
jgi:predicted DNA-binding transcriptional regulator AlpA